MEIHVPTCNFHSLFWFLSLSQKSQVITVTTRSFLTIVKTRLNCINCWQVFQCWLPQHFPKVTLGFIPLTPSIRALYFLSVLTDMSLSLSLSPLSIIKLWYYSIILAHVLTNKNAFPLFKDLAEKMLDLENIHDVLK